MSEPEDSTVRDRIAAAALDLLADVELADLARVLTPERLATLGPWSASTVRYQFGGGGRDGDGDGGRFAFERADLVLAVLDLALKQREEASLEAAEGYHRAAATFEQSQELDSLFAALQRNMASFIPGASADSDGAPRERIYHLAIATCDSDAEAARRLRTTRARQIQGYESMYAAFLASTGRRLRPGRTIGDLADAMYALLDGHLMRLRYDPAAPTAWVSDAVVALFIGLTSRLDDEPTDFERELRPNPGTPG